MAVASSTAAAARRDTLGARWGASRMSSSGNFRMRKGVSVERHDQPTRLHSATRSHLVEQHQFGSIASEGMSGNFN